MIKDFSRHIHQIWFQTGDLKEEWASIGSEDYFELQKSYIDFCKDKGWKYTLWREDTILELIQEHFPHYYKEFNALDSIIKKVDCARLMILYVYGGLYVDIDTYLARDLEEFLNLKEIVRRDYAPTMWHMSPEKPLLYEYKMVVGQEKTICEFHYNQFGIVIPKINNAVIFCSPKYDFFLKVIETGFKRRNNSIMNSFGVQTFSNLILEHMADEVNTLLDIDDYNYKTEILTLPYIYFYELDIDLEYYLKVGGTEEYLNSPLQYIVHKFDGNWDGEEYGQFLEKLTDGRISRPKIK